MRDESSDLLQTVLWIFEVIRTNKRCMLQRISETYAEAQELVATIPKDDGSARPRIEACFERFNTYRDRHDLGGAGWMLAAVRSGLPSKTCMTGW